jgi:hypothetical protein
MMTMYAVACQREILNVDVAKFYIGQAKMTKPDKQLIELCHKKHAKTAGRL